MRGRVDMSGVKEGGDFEIPEAGEHYAEIVEVRDGTSKENGDPMIAIKLRIVSGVSQDTWVWDNIVIPNPGSRAFKIMGRTKHFLHCIGEPYEGENVEWDSDAWMYKKCRIKVKIEEPNKYHKYHKAIVEQYMLEEEPGEGALENDPFAR